MIDSVLVPVDPVALDRRPVDVAASLARTGGLEVELIGVVPTGGEADARSDLARLAALAGAPDARVSVVASDDVVGVLVEAIADRPEALVVLGTRARGPVGELFLGSISEDLLARTDHPVVLVGPRVTSLHRGGPAMVAAITDDDLGALLAPTVAAWARSFGTQPWFVQVARPDAAASRTFGAGTVHRIAQKLRDDGVDAQWDVLHERDVTDALVHFTRARGGGVIAVVSRRWVDATQIHWTSTARSLVHRSPYPVLVVPAHDALVA